MERQLMKYDTIFGRSFSTKEQKRLKCGAFLVLCFIIMPFILLNVNVPFIGPLALVNLEVSMTARFKMLMSFQEISKTNPYVQVEEPILIYQNFSSLRSDVCEIIGNIRVHGNSSTIFVTSKQLEEKKRKRTCADTIGPYARKADPSAMRKVTKMRIKEIEPDNNIPRCSKNFNVPGVVFSTGGYAGNHFHDFTDVLIPLYITSQRFNRNVVFLITNKHEWWTSKYKLILNGLSSYDVVDLDQENEVLCFSRITVGLTANRELGIDPSLPPHYSTFDFTRFLRSTYLLRRESMAEKKYKNYRPRMLIVSRKKTRHLRNEGAVAKMAQQLGFDVVVEEMGWNMSEVAQFVNSFDVMMGVHGAGLTNMVFLPEGAVVVQIVPFGLDFLGRDYFQIPAKDMNLKYVEYQVSVNESTLLGRYPNDSEVYRDPLAIHDKGFHRFRSIYLDDQDVTLDLSRFKRTLFKAIEILNS